MNINKKNSIDRRTSIRYVMDDDAPLLRFNSLDRGDADDDDEEEGDVPKINSLFMYNDEEDTYRINSLKRSRLSERKKTKDLDKMNEDSEHTNTQPSFSMENDNANLININYKEKNLKPLYIIMLCYLIFCLIELTFGYKYNSITLMADAIHYFSESSLFGIYIMTIYSSRKRVTNALYFGYHIGEIIGVLARAAFLLGFSFWLLYYSILNFFYNEYVNGLVIIIIGIISAFFNLIMGLVLMLIGINIDIFFENKNDCKNQHSKSFTYVTYKVIQSCIIILAGVLAYFLPSKLYIDPCFSLFLTGFLYYKAFKLINNAIQILIVGSPLEFNTQELEKDLLEVKGVVEVDDIHVWSLNIGKISMSCQLFTSDPQNSLVLARELLKKKYKITETFIQVELSKSKKNKSKGNLN